MRGLPHFYREKSRSRNGRNAIAFTFEGRTDVTYDNNGLFQDP